MGRIADYLRGRDLVEEGEDRTLSRGSESETFPYVPPTSRTSLPAISESSALRIADIFACVRVLANAIASLPPRVYRRLPDGSRLPAGSDQRLAALLRRPEPGSTSADLLATIMVHLLVHGDCFLAKYRREGSIVQLACLDPQAVAVERTGDRVIYQLSRREGISEHGPEDVCHIKSVSQDGLRGISTVRAAAKVLQVNEGLVSYAASFLGNAARPGGILSLTDMPLHREQAAALKEDWQELFAGQEPGAGAGRIAVLSGDNMSFERVEPPMKDSEFLAQREVAAKECARAFGLPPWSIAAPTGDSLTYSNVAQQNRYLVDHSIRPWAVRIERAISNDSDLCPGGTYLALDFDGFLRGDAEQRAAYYKAALDGGWLTVNEIRAAEDLPPLDEGS